MPAPSPHRRQQRRRDALVFLAFAGPNLLLISAFIYFPLLSNLYYSTLNWRMGSTTATSTGIDNYVRLFTSPQGAEMWRVTITFTVVTVVASMVLGLLVALALNHKIPGVTAGRTAIFAPYVLSGVGVGMVWNFIFDPQLGLLGHLLRALGASSPEWYLDADLALVMVMIVYIWKNLGFCAVVFLAGLQSIPKDLIEAARIDRAGPFARFFKLTLPLLSPTVFFLTVTTILSSMQAFDILKIMTPSGNGTNTIVFELFLQGFGPYQNAGYAAAISVVLFVVLFAITAFQMRFIEKRVHYA
ncbi:sugar ABC transporter permease [Agrococcus sp. ARC_14]|uniref:carbohydrate ABC transporter permease n=1 Tax=Agrococcus sp. ARC_14 TaxID=2919927 RepID=UPI001F0578EC|nr:sugar ABC transporter permease [Agrococcus sp. ARC_14]